GVRRVQLRARTLDSARWHALAKEAAARCRAAGAEVLVNRDVALARSLKVGVHLGAEQLAALGERGLSTAQGEDLSPGLPSKEGRLAAKNGERPSTKSGERPLPIALPVAASCHDEAQ